MTEASRKRSYPDTPPWERKAKEFRRDISHRSPHRDSGSFQHKERGDSYRNQTQANKTQEDEQMRAWIAKEDDFVLNQSKKKAKIRVKDGRARPIDWLAMTLCQINHTFDPLEDDEDEEEMNVIDPSTLIETLDASQLGDLQQDIDVYMTLEKTKDNRKYWKVSCFDLCHHITLI